MGRRKKEILTKEQAEQEAERIRIQKAEYHKRYYARPEVRERIREYNKRYKKEHPDVVKKHSKVQYRNYTEEQRQRRIAKSKEWYMKNSEKMKEYQKRYWRNKKFKDHLLKCVNAILQTIVTMARAKETEAANG